MKASPTLSGETPPMSKSLFLCLAICKTVFGLAGNDLGSDDVKLDVEWLEASSDCHNLPTNATRQQSHTINPRIGDMSWALSKTSDYDKAPNEARVVCHLQFALQNVLKARGQARGSRGARHRGKAAWRPSSVVRRGATVRHCPSQSV